MFRSSQRILQGRLASALQCFSSHSLILYPFCAPELGRVRRFSTQVAAAVDATATYPAVQIDAKPSTLQTNDTSISFAKEKTDPYSYETVRGRIRYVLREFIDAMEQNNAQYLLELSRKVQKMELEKINNVEEFSDLEFVLRAFMILVKQPATSNPLCLLPSSAAAKQEKYIIDVEFVLNYRLESIIRVMTQAAAGKPQPVVYMAHFLLYIAQGDRQVMSRYTKALVMEIANIFVLRSTRDSAILDIRRHFTERQKEGIVYQAVLALLKLDGEPSSRNTFDKIFYIAFKSLNRINTHSLRILVEHIVYQLPEVEAERKLDLVKRFEKKFNDQITNVAINALYVQISRLGNKELMDRFVEYTMVYNKRTFVDQPLLNMVVSFDFEKTLAYRAYLDPIKDEIDYYYGPFVLNLIVRAIIAKYPQYVPQFVGELVYRWKAGVDFKSENFRLFRTGNQRAKLYTTLKKVKNILESYAVEAVRKGDAKRSAELRYMSTDFAKLINEQLLLEPIRNYSAYDGSKQ